MNEGRNNSMTTGVTRDGGDLSPFASRLSPIVFRPRVHAFAVAFVIATFCLLILGGTVTSKGVGLAVPDWPTSFGFNMFGLPLSMWVGGVLWEHSHRLMGSLVGLMAIIISMLLWTPYLNTRVPVGATLARPWKWARVEVTPNTGPRWLRWFGLATLLLIIIQGIMGGLRVTQISTTLAIIHGVTAQLVLCMTVVIAAATSRMWAKAASAPKDATTPMAGVRRVTIALFAVLFVQLVLGAVTRHSDAGLAIPDFPSAYGGVVPPLTQHGIDESLAQIPYDQVHGHFTPAQVGIHFAHRVWAIVVLGVAVWTAARVSQAFPAEPALQRPIVALACLLIVQVSLGVMVIWTGRHTEVATAHQTVGAAILATSVLLAIRVRLLGSIRRASLYESVSAPARVSPNILFNGAKA